MGGRALFFGARLPGYGHDPLSTITSGMIPDSGAENVVAGHITLYGAGGLGGRCRRFRGVGQIADLRTISVHSVFYLGFTMAYIMPPTKFWWQVEYNYFHYNVKRKLSIFLFILNNTLEPHFLIVFKPLTVSKS